MRRRWYLLLAGVAAFIAAVLWLRPFLLGIRTPIRTGTPASRPGDGRPNVVLISMDTTRPDHLGCFGYPRPTSPNVDRFAREGVRFVNARAQAPWTLPSHMALFTSMLPSHTGIEEFRPVLSSAIPTLPQILQGHGYTTAALVNDLQMKAYWGFNRGFGLWQEFADDTYQGTCEHITAQAIHWLQSTPATPFFLFLHYYDPHQPYNPPPAFRQRFGSSLAGQETTRILFRMYRPEMPIGDRYIFEQLIGSYDGAIAWLDDELGKLFAVLPSNTLVVLFSDHGEAFKEHGWTMHGANLYEEEIRTVLVMRHPAILPVNRTVKQPVMLMDVAPTILGFCDIQPPRHYEGIDVSPLWEAVDELRPPAPRPLPSTSRLILAETKAPFQGRALKMVALDDWKLIYSILDGSHELYHLPDEQTNLAGKEPTMVQALLRFATDWVEHEDYLLLYARGSGEFTVNLNLPQEGSFPSVVPVGGGNIPADYEVGPNGRWARWTCRPNGATKTLYVRLSDRDAPVRLDVKISGRRDASKVFLGTENRPVQQLPVSLRGEESAREVVTGKPVPPERDGFFVARYRGKGGPARPGLTPQIGTLDDKTIERLRTLGYLR